MIDKSAYIQIQMDILQDLGHPVKQGMTVLDFGCGVGEVVAAYRQRTIDAYGCDIELPNEPDPLLQSYIDRGIVRLIHPEPYTLPFDAQTFDVVVSSQVFEHVQNYAAALAEIKRVLKPGGVALHIFPSRYRLIEPHVLVPLATMVQSYWWLRLWASLGVRNQFQRGMSAEQTAHHNHHFLTQYTHYLSRRQIEEHLQPHYRDWSFVQALFVKHSGRGRGIYPLFRLFPFLNHVAGTFLSRVLVTYP
jgi:ubiquinone/menaquinone biosynthesis C-methylase UbiE